MKDLLILSLAVICILLFGKIIIINRDIDFLTQKDISLDKQILDNEIKFMWSEEERDIPADGTLTQIKSTDENTIYLGTVDTLVNNPLIKYPTNY